MNGEVRVLSRAKKSFQSDDEEVLNTTRARLKEAKRRETSTPKICGK